MIVDYQKCFWADSYLKKVEVLSDNINIIVYNDVMQKDIYIKCYQCVGMTQLIVWDEDIIEDIFIDEIVDEKQPMIEFVKQIYGTSSYGLEKNIEDRFFELKVVLIDGITFSVVSKNVWLFDKREDLYDPDLINSYLSPEQKENNQSGDGSAIDKM